MCVSMSGNPASRTSNVPTSSLNRRASFHSNTLKRRPLTRRASISTDPASYKDNARKRAEEKRQAEIERQKHIRKRNALSRKLDFDPDMMRCSKPPPSPPKNNEKKERCEYRVILMGFSL